MKKKLIAWMMSATMALGSMTLPVYAENEEVAVEFSDETDEETEEPETEMLDYVPIRCWWKHKLGKLWFTSSNGCNDSAGWLCAGWSEGKLYYRCTGGTGTC